MNKKYMLFLIILTAVIGIIFVGIYLKSSHIQEPLEFKWDDNYEGLVRLDVGESVLNDFVLLKEIRTNSVVVHVYHPSVECGLIDQDYEINKAEMQIHGFGISLSKIEQNSAILKLKSYPTFC